MEKKQFDEFWEIRCPKCNEIIDLEILVNFLKKKIENVEVAEKE
jgi:phage FluMu protein Com